MAATSHSPDVAAAAPVRQGHSFWPSVTPGTHDSLSPKHEFGSAVGRGVGESDGNGVGASFVGSGVLRA